MYLHFRKFTLSIIDVLIFLAHCLCACTCVFMCICLISLFFLFVSFILKDDQVKSSETLKVGEQIEHDGQFRQVKLDQYQH